MNRIHDYEAYNINKQTDKNLKEKKEDIIENSRTQEVLIKGVFLVFLSIVGNFLDTMLPIHTQSIIKNNTTIKHILTFITIYFVIDFSSNKVSNPLVHLKNSIFIYILFVLFIKSTYIYSIISLMLLCINYVIGNYIEYYSVNHIDNRNLKHIEKNINFCIFLNLVIGFLHYMYNNYNNYNN